MITTQTPRVKIVENYRPLWQGGSNRLAIIRLDGCRAIVNQLQRYGYAEVQPIRGAHTELHNLETGADALLWPRSSDEMWLVLINASADERRDLARALRGAP